MSAPTDRLICPRCGANNFATQAACWKCGAALAGGGAPLTPVPRAGSAAPVSAIGPVAPARSVDPAVAVWATVALAFFFPFLAVPVGLVFLMLDDRRKVDLGKIALIWGIVFSLLHLVLTWGLMGAALAQLRDIAPSQLQRLQEQRQSAPSPDTPVSPLRLPGLGP